MMREEVENLKYLSKEERINKIKDENFRRALFEDKNHYPFVWCVQDLKGDEILSFLDDNILPYLEKDEKLKDKLNAIITSENPYVNIFLSSDKAISLIVKEIDTLRIFLRSLDINFGKKFANYLIDNNINITYLGYLSSEVQVEILKDKELYNKIRSIDLPSNFLSSLSIDAIEQLIKDKYFENIIINYEPSKLSYLFDKGLSLPVYLQENNIMIDKFVKIENIKSSHAYLERLENNNPYLKNKIMEKRKKMYIEKVASIDKEVQIFPQYLKYLNKEESLSRDTDRRVFHILSTYPKKSNCFRMLQRLTETIILEMIIDVMLEDITYNALENIKIILNYVKDKEDYLVSPENLSIYKKIYNFYDLSFDERIEFFNKMMARDNMIEAFYDDFRNVLNHSYMNIKNSLLDLNTLNKEPSIDGIPVYKLDGEPFNMLVHNTSSSRNSNPYSIWHDRLKTVSLSLIGDSHIGTYGDPYHGILLGFKTIDIDKIMHVYKSDSYSGREHGTSKIPSIMSPEELLENTKDFNEILVKEEKTLSPDYVVCFDEIKPGDVEASKLLGNIPLIKINTNKYNKAVELNEMYDDRYKTLDDYSYPISYRKGR